MRGDVRPIYLRGYLVRNAGIDLPGMGVPLGFRVPCPAITLIFSVVFMRTIVDTVSEHGSEVGIDFDLSGTAIQAFWFAVQPNVTRRTTEPFSAAQKGRPWGRQIPIRHRAWPDTPSTMGTLIRAAAMLVVPPD